MFQPIRMDHVIVSTYSTNVPWSCDKSWLSIHIMWSISQSRDIKGRKLKAIKYSIRDRWVLWSVTVKVPPMVGSTWTRVRSGFLAWLGLKARSPAWLFVASGLRKSWPEPSFEASLSFGFLWPASPGVVCFQPGWLTSHGPHVWTHSHRKNWL